MSEEDAAFKPEGYDDQHLLYENVAPWEIFVICRTQWRRGPDGLYDSMDYNALLSVIALFDVDSPLDTLERVQLIELGAKNRFREHRFNEENKRNG